MCAKKESSEAIGPAGTGEQPGSVLIIANPVSGFGRAARLAESLRAELESRGTPASLFLTSGPGDGLKEARRAGASHDVVACIGGDGTVNEIANGLLSSPASPAILPTGTANIVAKEFGLRPDVAHVARTIVEGRTVSLDAGTFRDRIFLCVAGVGFDASVARRYASQRLGTGSYAKYLRPFFEVFLSYRPPELELIVDGKRLKKRAAWVLVSNLPSYGGPLRFCGSADPSDGLLDAASLRRCKPAHIPRYFLFSLLHRFEDLPDTTGLKGREFTIRPKRGSVPVQLDGDFVGECGPEDPAVIRVLPEAVRLRVP